MERSKIKGKTQSRRGKRKDILKERMKTPKIKNF